MPVRSGLAAAARGAGGLAGLAGRAGVGAGFQQVGRRVFIDRTTGRALKLVSVGAKLQRRRRRVSSRRGIDSKMLFLLLAMGGA